MANKVLSVEISYAVTKVALTDEKSKNPKIYKDFTILTPPGVYDDGMIQENDDFVELLNENLRANGMKCKNIAFSIASSRIASREVMIPFCKQKQISAVVAASAQEYFPINLDMYRLAYSIQDVVEQVNTTKQYKLWVYAAPITILDSYTRLADKLGMNVVAKDYNGNSLYQVVKKECTEGTQLVIKIDELDSYVMAIHNGSGTFTRTIPYGYDDAVRTMMAGTAYGNHITYDQALSNFMSERCIFTSFAETEEQETAEEANTSDGQYQDIDNTGEFVTAPEPTQENEEIQFTDLNSSKDDEKEAENKAENKEADAVESFDAVSFGTKSEDASEQEEDTKPQAQASRVADTDPYAYLYDNDASENSDKASDSSDTDASDDEVNQLAAQALAQLDRSESKPVDAENTDAAADASTDVENTDATADASTDTENADATADVTADDSTDAETNADSSTDASEGKAEDSELAKEAAQTEVTKKPVVKLTEEERQIRQAKRANTFALADLMNGISKIIDFYNTRNQGQTIDKIIVTGIGGEFQGLPGLLGNTIGTEVTVLKKIAGYDPDHTTKKNLILGVYITNLGAAMAPAVFDGDTLGKKSNREEKKSTVGSAEQILNVAGIVVLVGGLVGSVAMVGLAAYPYYKAKVENIELRQQVTGLAAVIPTYQKYTLSKQAYDYMNMIDQVAVVPCNDLEAFLKELEEKLPSGALVQSLNGDTEGVTMTFSVPNKAASADVIEQLRTFDSLLDVVVMDVTDTTGTVQAGEEGSVTFSLVGSFIAAKTPTVEQGSESDNTVPETTVEEDAQTLQDGEATTYTDELPTADNTGLDDVPTE